MVLRNGMVYQVGVLDDEKICYRVGILPQGVFSARGITHPLGHFKNPQKTSLKCGTFDDSVALEMDRGELHFRGCVYKTSDLAAQ